MKISPPEKKFLKIHQKKISRVPGAKKNPRVNFYYSIIKWFAAPLKASKKEVVHGLMIFRVALYYHWSDCAIWHCMWKVSARVCLPGYRKKIVREKMLMKVLYHACVVRCATLCKKDNCVKKTPRCCSLFPSKCLRKNIHVFPKTRFFPHAVKRFMSRAHREKREFAPKTYT